MIRLPPANQRRNETVRDFKTPKKPGKSPKRAPGKSPDARLQASESLPVLRPNDSNATLEKETLTKDEKRAAKEMFDKYDLDNSGEISYSEIKKLLKDLR